MWVLAVGVLEWERPDLWDPFPKEARRDTRLVDLLRGRVPADQLVYVQDKNASLGAIQKGLSSVMARAKAGDTLLIYYAGHGYCNDDGLFFFAPYDGGDEDDSYWAGRQLVQTISSEFRGSSCWIVADCCHSGALTNEVRRLKNSSVSFGTLTSSVAAKSSTGNWTFTDAVIDGLSGHPLADLDGDGAISFFELGSYVSNQMAFAEGQEATMTTTGDFSSSASVAKVSREARAGEDDQVEVEYEGEWYKARVLESDGKSARIKYLGEDWPEERVPLSRVRDVKSVNRYAVGSMVEVESEGDWYEARVLSTGADGRHKVRYVGYDSDDDEWVGPKRIRLPEA